MLPSANICTAVRTMRLGADVNSGLTQPNCTADSQNARNTATASVPRSAFSLRRQNGRRGGARRSLVSASFALLMASTLRLDGIRMTAASHDRVFCSVSHRRSRSLGATPSPLWGEGWGEGVRAHRYRQSSSPDLLASQVLRSQ